MDSLQSTFGPEIRGISDDLEAAHGRADWGTRAPSDSGRWRKPDVPDFQWALGQRRGMARHRALMPG
eukprot:91779-Alexandrium_andersonii.AAC.1